MHWRPRRNNRYSVIHIFEELRTERMEFRSSTINPALKPLHLKAAEFYLFWPANDD